MPFSVTGKAAGTSFLRAGCRQQLPSDPPATSKAKDGLCSQPNRHGWPGQSISASPAPWPAEDWLTELRGRFLLLGRGRGPVTRWFPRRFRKCQALHPPGTCLSLQGWHCSGAHFPGNRNDGDLTLLHPWQVKMGHRGLARKTKGGLLSTFLASAGTSVLALTWEAFSRLSGEANGLSHLPCSTGHSSPNPQIPKCPCQSLSLSLSFLPHFFPFSCFSPFTSLPIQSFQSRFLLYK